MRFRHKFRLSTQFVDRTKTVISQHRRVHSSWTFIKTNWGLFADNFSSYPLSSPLSQSSQYSMDSGFLEQVSTSPTQMTAISYQQTTNVANTVLNNHSLQSYNSYNGKFWGKIPSRFLPFHSIYWPLCLREIFANITCSITSFRLNEYLIALLVSLLTEFNTMPNSFQDFYQGSHAPVTISLPPHFSPSAVVPTNTFSPRESLT